MHCSVNVALPELKPYKPLCSPWTRPSSKPNVFPFTWPRWAGSIGPVILRFRALMQKQSMLICRFHHPNILSPGTCKKSDGVGVSLKWGPSSELQITGHAVAEASATLPGRPHASPGPDVRREVRAALTKGFRCESLTEPRQGSGTRK